MDATPPLNAPPRNSVHFRLPPASDPLDVAARGVLTDLDEAREREVEARLKVETARERAPSRAARRAASAG
jgi:hypothetical protein